MSYFALFWQSNLLEWPVYLLLLRAFQPGLSLPRAAAWITCLNSVTHPVIFFGIMNAGLPYLTSILCAEAFAILVEFALLARVFRIPWGWVLLASVTANLLSWQFAPMLTYIWGSR